jgi:hypothetical protein
MAAVTAWPNPNDYVDALQNPRLAFDDPALKQGAIITDKLGLPRPISGNFAIVFEIADGERRWAVRCFARETRGQEQRYAAISRHLSRHGLPFMVGFAYLPKGIRVRGQWYPVVKMEWVRGVRLDTYIEQNLTNTATLFNLSRQWGIVTKALTMAEIAHGDLQHGNIVVSEGDLRLIDYDGMIVPDLIGVPGGEIGHRHYQHPTRTTDTGIGANSFLRVDTFSSWIIWASLVAVGIDPSLWGKTGAGDDRLLFTERDFKFPTQSKTLSLLMNHRDARLQEVGARLYRVFQSPSYLDCPDLDDGGILEPRRRVSAADWVPGITTETPAVSISPPAPTTTPQGNGWIEDHVRGTRPAPPAAPVIETPIPPARRPMQDIAPPTAPPPEMIMLANGLIDFAPDFVRRERERLRANYEDMTVVERAIFLFTPSLYTNWGVYNQFGKYEVVKKKREAEAVYKELMRQLSEANASLQAAQRVRDEAQRQFDADSAALLREIERLNEVIAQVGLDEQDAVNLHFNEARLRHYEQQLREMPLKPNQIRKVGSKRVAALQEAGITHYADIHPGNEPLGLEVLSQLPGGDPQAEWDGLMRKRRELEMSIPFYMPPDAPELLELRHGYAGLRASYESQRANAQARLEQLYASGSTTFARIDTRIQNAQAHADTLNMQAANAEREFSRYDPITPSNLLRKMRDLP